MIRSLVIATLLLSVVPAPPVSADDPIAKLSSRERKTRVAALAFLYQDFVEKVQPIITNPELDLFLSLETDAQRDAFIEEFWEQRDDNPADPGNAFRNDYLERWHEAKAKFRHADTDRGRIYLLRGRPDEAVEITMCRYLNPIEIWFYGAETEHLGRPILIFHRPTADYRLWDSRQRSSAPRISVSGKAVAPAEGFRGALQELLSPEGLDEGVDKVFYDHPEFIAGRILTRDPLIRRCPNSELILEAVHWNEVHQERLQHAFDPPAVDEESVRTMLRASVVANPEAKRLSVTSSIRFGGARGSRTVTELLLTVPTGELQALDVDGQRFFNIDVLGETTKGDRLFERFRYRYDFPADEAPAELPVVVERHLREGDYELRVKVIDANSRAEGLIVESLQVPAVTSSGAAPASSEIDELFASSEGAVIRLAPLAHEILTGRQRIETVVFGSGVSRVDFYLDGEKIMSKRQPPWTLERDFGPVPRKRHVRALAYDAEGNLLDGDELAVNRGHDPFSIRLISPRFQKNLAGLVRVELAVEIPEGKRLDRIDLFVNDRKVAAIHEPPFVQSVLLPSTPELSYLRAVAFLQDPTVAPAEDAVILNADDYVEQVEVHLVELPTTVLRDGRPIRGLDQESFTVLEGGTPVPIARFEFIENLPLSVGIAIDSSASMRERMAHAQTAGRAFLRKILREDDRAFIVAFDRQPYLAAGWSNSLAQLTSALVSLRTEEATALHDAIVYSLYQFPGVRGQKALILISDGEDTASRFGFDQALEFARRSGVPVYVVGVAISMVSVETRLHLSRLSQETGGKAWFIDDPEKLQAIYDEIETELRSQYLLGIYRPAHVEPGGDFRPLRVVVRDAEVRTISGYYP
ncbi:MAG TPA: VWA domain-containing protein [Thermoanaerobaculia bacterium]|nr:VWA domain-containing protein [Thermoanaerobaculia bacterium]